MANVPAITIPRTRTSMVDLLCTDELRHIVKHADAQSLLALCQVGGQLARLSLARMNPAQRVFHAVLMEEATGVKRYYFRGLPCDVIGQIFGHLAT